MNCSLIAKPSKKLRVGKSQSLPVGNFRLGYKRFDQSQRNLTLDAF